MNHPAKGVKFHRASQEEERSLRERSLAMIHPCPATGPIAAETKGAQTRAIVVQLVERDGHYCHYCRIPLQVYGVRGPVMVWVVGGRSIGLARVSYEIDHKTPRKLGGGNDLSNLVLACQFCNSHKRDTPYARFVQDIEEWKARYYWRAILSAVRAQCDYSEVLQ